MKFRRGFPQQVGQHLGDGGHPGLQQEAGVLAEGHTGDALEELQQGEGGGALRCGANDGVLLEDADEAGPLPEPPSVTTGRDDIGRGRRRRRGQSNLMVHCRLGPGGSLLYLGYF